MENKENGKIEVYGARVHNLKNIDVEIPHDSLTVITGLSGSGKSSLAFDTIFAEGPDSTMGVLAWTCFWPQGADQSSWLVASVLASLLEGYGNSQ